MQSQKAHKIDLTLEYPCPCHRRGQLTPITLTEAFGCNRCQRIFVLQEGGYSIEELSTSYPYKRVWRWTGHQWTTANPKLGRAYIPLTLVIIFAIIFLLLITASQSSIALTVSFRVIAALVLSTMLVLMLWLACRR